MSSMIGSTTNVGKTGTLGSEYDVQYNRYKQLKAGLGFSDFKSSLFMTGVDGNVVLQRIENNVESGNQTTGNGTDGDLLSWNSYLKNNKNSEELLFQSKDGKLFTDIDFSKDNYKILDRNGFAKSMGIDAYDTFTINQNNVTAYEFTFDGLGDGTQANIVQNINEVQWGALTSVYREVDTSYWSTSELAKGSVSITSTQDALSNDSLQVMLSTSSTWLTEDMKTTLSKYTKGSTDYYNQLLKFAIKTFDQVGNYNGTYK